MVVKVDNIKVIAEVINKIADILEKDPNKWNKTDTHKLLRGTMKNYVPKYDYEISSGRISGFLDILELVQIIEKNEKGLFSLTKIGKNRLKDLGVRE